MSSGTSQQQPASDQGSTQDSISQVSQEQTLKLIYDLFTHSKKIAEDVKKMANEIEHKTKEIEGLKLLVRCQGIVT